MEIPQIPETATETYLEHLQGNIARQLKRTKNKKIKAHLEGMLKEVQRRLAEFQQKSQREPEQAAVDDLGVFELTEIVEEVSEEPPGEELESPEEADVFVLTDIVEEVSEEISPENEELSEREREVVKDRLRDVLEKFQDRKQASPQQSGTMILSDIMQEVDKEVPLDTPDLSEQAQEKIKNRLKGILEAFRARSQESIEQSFLETLTQVPSDEAEVPIGDQETIQFRLGEFTQKFQSGDREFRPVSTDEEFIAACEKVSQGNSPGLFDSIALSDRERDLVNAFIAHLSTYKGLKKQQAFEMQHLTARSIHELDLIFKTYKIQGYLRAELANVYQRLLNLRSRFSILLN